MKKKIKLIMLFAMMAAMLCACGKKGDDSLSDNQIEVDPDDYVKLGDYSNLSVEVTYNANPWEFSVVITQILIIWIFMIIRWI